MPPKPKTPAERAAERSAIIQAAVDIFSRSGYEAVTMRAIASACNFSPTKLYYYFSNKEEIYVCLMREGFSLLFQKVKDAYCSGNDAEERLVKVNNTIFDFGLKQQNYYRIILEDYMPQRDDYLDTPLYPPVSEATDIALAFYAFWCKCVNEVAASYGFTVSKTQFSALFSTIHGTIHLFGKGVFKIVDVDYQEVCADTNKIMLNWIESHRCI